MKKKLWIGIAAVVLILAIGITVIVLLTGNEPKVIGICYRENSSAENSAYRSGLEQMLKDKGYQVIVTDADGDQAKQLELIGELKKRNCRALIVEPVMTSAAEELIQAVAQSGVPAVLINRYFDLQLLQPYPQIAYVGTDPGQPGTVQGEMTNALQDGGDLNGDGIVSYIMLQGPEDHVDTVLRTQALEKALNESQLEIHRLSVGYGELTAESGRKLLRQELAAYGKDIEVVFCGNDLIAQGAAEAITDGGRTVGKDIYLFSVGGEKESVESGVYSGTAYLDPAAQASAAVDALTALLAGKTAEQVRILPYIAVASEK